jgi:hypothetical protein
MIVPCEQTADARTEYTLVRTGIIEAGGARFFDDVLQGWPCEGVI